VGKIAKFVTFDDPLSRPSVVFFFWPARFPLFPSSPIVSVMWGKNPTRLRNPPSVRRDFSPGARRPTLAPLMRILAGAPA